MVDRPTSRPSHRQPTHPIRNISDKQLILSNPHFNRHRTWICRPISVRTCGACSKGPISSSLSNANGNPPLPLTADSTTSTGFTFVTLKRRRPVVPARKTPRFITRGGVEGGDASTPAPTPAMKSEVASGTVPGEDCVDLEGVLVKGIDASARHTGRNSTNKGSVWLSISNSITKELQMASA